ncbi:MAG: ATP-binding cassette domain-containing protein [Terrimonas sp.]|nr:ATP-binding cassette domain-containing protein [Terrimonas sp.]
MPDIIRVQHLSKSFKDLTAVNDLSFSVPQGCVYGFLGQNGAGKSTTIRMLLTLIEPSSGDIEIFGLSLQRHRQQILKNTGAVIEKPDLYKYLSALDNIRLFAKLGGVHPSRMQLMEKLDKVGLAARAGSKVKTFSQGMKQRLGIAIALVHDPELVILDEPVNGLDPQGIADIRKLIIHLSKEEKKTVFVSSHLLAEMEMVADHMLIIDKGKKIVEGPVKSLLNPDKMVIELETKDINAVTQLIQGSSWGDYYKKQEEGKILLEFGTHAVPAFNTFLVQQQVQVLSLRPRHSLEDYFLSLTT